LLHLRLLTSDKSFARGFLFSIAGGRLCAAAGLLGGKSRGWVTLAARPARLAHDPKLVSDGGAEPW